MLFSGFLFERSTLANDILLYVGAIGGAAVFGLIIAMTIIWIRRKLKSQGNWNFFIFYNLSLIHKWGVSCPFASDICLYQTLVALGFQEHNVERSVEFACSPLGPYLFLQVLWFSHISKIR